MENTICRAIVNSWALAGALLLGTAPALAQERSGPPVLVEKKMTSLPSGALVWRLENFRTAAEAQAVAGPTGLVAQAAGKVWLFTLGPGGGSSPGATKVAEIGPLPPASAKQYSLQIRESKNEAGSSSPVHTHPGPEAFYILAGEQSVKTPDGVRRLTAGQGAVGAAAGTPMQVSNTGSMNVHMFILFVLDADKPFSSPAKFP